MYSVEHNGVTVKITEKQYNRLWANEILDILIKKGLPIENNFDNVNCLQNNNADKVVIMNCFKRTGIPNYNNGKTTTLKLVPLWLL